MNSSINIVRYIKPSHLFLAAYGMSISLTIWAIQSDSYTVFIALICVIASIIGANLAHRWVMQGVTLDTIDNALKHHQRLVYIILFGMGAIATSFASLILIQGVKVTDLAIFATNLRLPHWIPTIILLYIAEYLNLVILGLGCFALGLVVFFVGFGRGTSQPLPLLMATVIGMILPLAIFSHHLLPITGMLGEPLYGRQVKTFDQMKGYWTGDAVFVTNPKAQLLHNPNSVGDIPE